jgi:hypothetical protein
VEGPFLSHIAAHGVCVDVHAARGGDSALLGRAILPLHRLLL